MSRSAAVDDEDVLDPQLAGSILPRLQRIVALLQQAAQEGSSLSTKAQAGEEKKATAANGGQVQGDGDDDAQGGGGAPSSAGPSIALGAVSEDDYSLYDFLFASSSRGDAASSSTTPSELSLPLLREARELRDVYRKAERACQAMQGAKWAIEEQRVAIDELEAIKEAELSKARFQSQMAAAKTIPAKRTNGTDDGPPRRPMGSELLLHFRLSSQIVQALLTSLQASYSSAALPPPPIPRPGKRQGKRQARGKDEDEDDAWDVPACLSSLPIWTSSASAASSSPTPSTLLPSLVIVHTSLDEALLRARTHRANTQRIVLLQQEVAELRRARRARVRSLRDAAAELRDLVGRGQGDVAMGNGGTSRSKSGKTQPRPVNRADVLAYAAELARTTSAPPGWGGAATTLAKQNAEAAARDGEQDEQAQGEGVTKDEAGDEDVTMQEVKEGQNELAGPQSAAENAAKTAESGTPASATAAPESKPAQQQQQTGASSSLLLLALEEQQRREQAKNGGADGQNPSALFDPATSASSAPHTLPFPSDADMRRGLMGVAMLADGAQEAEEGLRADQQQPAMQGLLPSWREFGRLKRLEEQEQQANVVPLTSAAAPVQQTLRPEGARRPVEASHDQDASGFGLDL